MIVIVLAGKLVSDDSVRYLKTKEHYYSSNKTDNELLMFNYNDLACISEFLYLTSSMSLKPKSRNGKGDCLVSADNKQSSLIHTI